VCGGLAAPCCSLGAVWTKPWATPPKTLFTETDPTQETFPLLHGTPCTLALVTGGCCLVWATSQGNPLCLAAGSRNMCLLVCCCVVTQQLGCCWVLVFQVPGLLLWWVAIVVVSSVLVVLVYGRSCCMQPPACSPCDMHVYVHCPCGAVVLALLLPVLPQSLFALLLPVALVAPIYPPQV
jgi:hypothetical protein